MTLHIGDTILLVAVLQTLWLAAVLLALPGRPPVANRLLAAMLLALALILLELVLVRGGAGRYYPVLLGFSLPAYFLLAPLYYLHARVVAGQGLQRADALHLLPVLAGSVVCLPFLLQPAADKLAQASALLAGEPQPFPLMAVVLLSILSFTGIGYFFRAHDLLQRLELELKEQSASAGVMAAGWLGQLSLAFCCFLLLLYLAAAELFFFAPYRSATPFLGLFGHAIAGFVFVVSWQSYRRPELFALHRPGALPAVEAAASARVKYEKNPLSPQQLDQLEQRLLQCMRTAQPYLEGELRLADLAAQLNLPAHQLSQVINVRQGCSFHDFINRQRVQHARQLLEAGATRSMLDVALASGFNSKASFNRVFRKELGCSPSDWQRQRSSEKNTTQLAR